MGDFSHIGVLTSYRRLSLYNRLLSYKTWLLFNECLRNIHIKDIYFLTHVANCFLVNSNCVDKYIFINEFIQFMYLLLP